MKGIEAWLGGRKVYVLGFAGGLENVGGTALGTIIYAVYYDPDDTLGNLEHCTIDCLQLAIEEWKK